MAILLRRKEHGRLTACLRVHVADGTAPAVFVVVLLDDRGVVWPGALFAGGEHTVLLRFTILEELVVQLLLLLVEFHRVAA